MRWIQQQHEKVRQKRDVPFGPLSGYNNQYGLLRPPIDFSTSLNSPRLSFSPSGTFHEAIPRAPRIEYRDTAHSIFPDPLFKEQWYLVSKVCIGMCKVNSFDRVKGAHHQPQNQDGQY